MVLKKKICNKFSFIDQPNYYKKHEKQGYVYNRYK